MSEPSDVLARCIQPLELDTFFAEYWEQKTLVVSRDQPGYFGDLISLVAIDHILSSTALRVPGFRLVREGAQIPTQAYTTTIAMTPGAFDGLIDIDRVYAEYRNGATIVLQALERSWTPLIEFCKALEQYLGHPVQANLYLTPARAQGFAAHHDTHDTLILQVEGHKRWKIYDAPFPLPLSKQRSLPGRLQHGEVVRDFALRAGDTLYMPRGVIHEALTSDSYSLHLTIGIKVWTWHDALSRVVSKALADCEQDVAFRKSLPRNFATGDASGELTETFGDLLERFMQHLVPDDVHELMADQFVTSRWSYRKRQLLDLHGADSLRADSQVSRRRDVIVRIVPDADTVTLAFHGKQVVVPAHAAEAVHFIAAAGRFAVGDIPGDLDEAGKLVLVRRLIREGLLSVENSSSAE